MMMRRALIGLLIAGAIAFGSSASAQPAETADQTEIRAVIARMEAAWNRGDFRGYMEGFWNPGVVFVSGGAFRTAGKARSITTCATMAARRSGAAICISTSSASRYSRPTRRCLISNYRLERPERPQTGINTRLFRKINGRWVIAMNHVSSYDPSAAAGR